jgi:hypothetical protein
MSYAIIDPPGLETIRIQYSGSNPLYIGKAIPGTLISEAAWQIQRTTYSGANLTVREWADDGLFSQIWADRAGLSYS